jgi:hypothetical protein
MAELSMLPRIGHGRMLFKDLVCIPTRDESFYSYSKFIWSTKNEKGHIYDIAKHLQ